VSQKFFKPLKFSELYFSKTKKHWRSQDFDIGRTLEGSSSPPGKRFGKGAVPFAKFFSDFFVAKLKRFGAFLHCFEQLIVPAPSAPYGHASAKRF